MSGGQPTVVKLGGSILEDAALRGRALDAVAAAWKAGEELVLVHGGGKKIDSLMEKLGIPKQTVRGLRVTDDQTLDVVVAVLAGVINKTIVAELAARGIPACGLSGADGATIAADVHPAVDGFVLGHVGKVVSANPTLIHAVRAKGFLPVIGSLGLGRGGQLLNINADASAAAIAVAVAAKRLVYLTDVAGLLDDRGQLVPSLTIDTALQLVDYSIVKGGMLPKLRSAVDAVSGGVSSVLIVGPEQHAVALGGGHGGTHLVAA